MAASPSLAPTAETPSTPGDATSLGGAQVAAREDFDRTAFAAALTLGSVWALLNLRSGPLRWRWLCVASAVPAALVVAMWALTVWQTFAQPYYAVFDRGHIVAAVVAALLLRVALTVPMALEAARTPSFWTPSQAGARKLGLVALGVLLTGLALDRATYGSRRAAAVASMKPSIAVAVNYLGRRPESTRVGLWRVEVRGPVTQQTLPMAFRVSDEANPQGKDVAQAAESLWRDDPNHPYLYGLGSAELRFEALGPHPRYTLYVDGQEMRSGDLQAESAR